LTVDSTPTSISPHQTSWSCQAHDSTVGPLLMFHRCQHMMLLLHASAGAPCKSTQQTAECHLGRKLTPDSTNRAPTHNSNSSSSHAAKNNRHGPCFKVLCHLPLPAKAKAIARACYLLLFPIRDSNLRLLDHTQARYHCASATAGVMQHHYPKALMKCQLRIFPAALAA